MTQRSRLSAGLVTETVLENCSVAYTRSRWLTGTSGSEAAPGAWPAQAARTVSRAVIASHVVRIVRFTLAPRRRIHRVVSPVLDVGRFGRGREVSRWHGRGDGLTDRQSHHSDLLLLGDDDLLGQAPELFVPAVAQLGLRHVDRAPVVRNHHRDEV